MKILIISHMYPSSAIEINGVFVHEQVRELINEGHEVKVVSPVPYVPVFFNTISSKWSRYETVPYQDKIDNVEIYYPKYIAYPKSLRFHLSGERMFKGIKSLIKEIYGEFKFDLIHAHTALPDGSAAMQIAKIYNVPLITTIHGLDFEHTVHRGSKFHSKIEQVLMYSNKIILVSNKLLSIKRKYFPDIQEGKFQVIHNGVSDLFLNNFQDNSGSNQKEIVILSASTLIPRKGINYNILAMKELLNYYPYLKYKIIGEGSQRTELEQKVKELGMEKNIFFLGNKTREEMVKNFDTCDIFVLPSWKEAFGVVYIEAMSRGKAVVGCKGEGVEEIITDGVEGLLVSPQNTKDLVEKIKYLVDNPQLRLEMGKNGRFRVVKEFTWKKVARELGQVYQNS
ncbi:glycosyltransferase [Sediminibacillus halophilus]|uniref:Uncharacterized protein n=1 Tax=Sediminibacillus halophilus TaxID=482461 RepID=A0A1G9UA06_9BACI|nr:glycosyltransferase [Sediminibacillus halophilus]SDM56564.1 hypothetical protein SAMN05216244_2925 [Sediminibacillus halophilus]